MIKKRVRFAKRTNRKYRLYTQLAKFIKIWQFDTEFGKFDFTFTQVDDIAAVADLEQQHPDWKEFLRN
jgi:pterin-4a-carbinolamine dehydratase